jgi:hypothetical protein
MRTGTLNRPGAGIYPGFGSGLRAVRNFFLRAEPFLPYLIRLVLPASRKSAGKTRSDKILRDLLEML